MQKKTKDALRRADMIVAGAIGLAIVMGGACTAYAPSADKLPVVAFAKPVALPTAAQIVASDVSLRQAEDEAAPPAPRAPTEAELAGLKILAKTECLADAMYYEARGEGVDGQLAIAEVVYNRARNAEYPRDICRVVFEGSHERTGCQFSFTCNGEMLRQKSPVAWRQAQRLALRIVTGNLELGDTTGGALSFHAVDVQPGWSDTMLRTTQIGHHIFYRPIRHFLTRGA